MSKDNFGDRMKAYEKRESITLMPFVPVVVRIDGKRFSKWTQGLERPYDKRLTDLMVGVTKRLVEETGAVTGYTQSDEITLVFVNTNAKSEIFLGGRVQKMTSILASMATAWFNEAVPEAIPEKAGKLALFDCRVWSVPNMGEAANAFLWREQDATRNSIQGAARSVYSHKACHKRSTSELQDMLMVRGINWNDYPSFFKRGTYVQRKKTRRRFTVEEIDKLPEQHDARKNPNLMIERVDVQVLEIPPLSKIANRAEFICEAEAPKDSTLHIKRST